MQKHDAMCILPINIVNEKVYIFLWFWFYILAIVTAFALIFRALIIFNPRLRVIATHTHCRLANPDYIREVLRYGRVGDWFLLDLLAKNIDPINFRDLIIDLKDKLELTKDPKNGI